MGIVLIECLGSLFVFFCTNPLRVPLLSFLVFTSFGKFGVLRAFGVWLHISFLRPPTSMLWHNGPIPLGNMFHRVRQLQRTGGRRKPVTRGGCANSASQPFLDCATHRNLSQNGEEDACCVFKDRLRVTRFFQVVVLWPTDIETRRVNACQGP